MVLRKFYLLLLLISFFGLFLRVVDYDTVPPQDETFDELMYTWGGVSLLREGVPSSWSNFEPYKNFEYVNRHGVDFKIVTPQLDKPPLYMIINGAVVSLFGVQNYYDTPHSIIRILPLILSFFTIFLTGLFAKIIFSARDGLVSAVLYSTVPTIVLANRLSLTENLLTPLVLLTLILFTSKNLSQFKIIVVGVLAVLCILTKQIGLALGGALGYYLYWQKQFKNLYIIIGFSVLGILLFFSYGAIYDFALFLDVQQAFRIAHTLAGLPEFIASIFRFPTLGAKERVFLDGSILISLILLFSSPLWLLVSGAEQKKRVLLLGFPFFYLLLGAIGESGSAPFTFWGWYVFPLFPFAMIILSKFLLDFYKKQEFFSLMLLILILGSSTVRFIFLNLNREFTYLWQYTFIIAVSGFLFSSLFLSKKYSRIMLIVFFGIFILVNVIVDLRLKDLYPKAIEIAL